MARIERSRRRQVARRFVPLALALLLAGAPPAAAPVAARTHLAGDETTVTITLTIDLRGDAAAAALPRIQAAFDNYWKPQTGRGLLFGCRIEFKSDIRVAFARFGADQITIHTVASGGYFVSNVVGDAVTSDRSGTWASNIEQAKAAHEMGHLLGLPDEYVHIDKDNDGVRDPGEPTLPDPSLAPEYRLANDWNGNGKVDFDDVDSDGKVGPSERIDVVQLRPGQTRSLMAEHPGTGFTGVFGDVGRGIQARHLDAIARLHRVPACFPLKGKITGRWTHTTPSFTGIIDIDIDARLTRRELQHLVSNDGLASVHLSTLVAVGSVIRNTWNWTAADGTGSCSGSGTTGVAPDDVMSSLWEHPSAADTTPVATFDVPDAGMYVILVHSQDPSYPVTCSWGDTTDVNFLTPLLGRYPTGMLEPADPQVRSPNPDGTLSGSYETTFSPNPGETITLRAEWLLVPEEGDPGVG